MSTSQIDYILHNATIAFLSDYKIHDQCHSNTSSHVPVSAKINVKSKPTNKAIKSSYVSKFKIQWKDIDSETYHNHISNELSQHNIESNSIEESINFLCNCLKNPLLMDNYRGIAVTPVISKLFECTILPRLTVNFNQSSLQFGFTKGLSMLMASLIITEARAEVKLVTMEPLFLITVDSQKAFDVVDHIILLDALYDHTQKHPLWSIVKNLYSGQVQESNAREPLVIASIFIRESKFSGGRESALCKCCGTSDEDIIHFLLLCPALHQQRKETFSKLKSYVISVIGLGYWSKEFKGHLDLTRLIVDSSFLLPMLRNMTELDKIQRLATDMCYRLHSQRVWKLQGK
ncbi:unnamed protein product [Mytilus coruscus]|uniref:Uncharacterized protein n=1 Tax=Mytilus coruscus TaxID=42192 RepID=A0A6J8EIJ0_MYTCO|nr:unnamed protein product [Mytilus coruscus]